MRAFVEGFDGALAYCAVFLFLHGTCRRQLSSQDWWSAGARQAGLIVDGEWWRTFTALGLHADLGHLASNLLVGSLLGLFLAQPLGAGLAWVAILLGGAMGTRSTRYSIHGTHGDRRLNRRLRGTATRRGGITRAGNHHARRVLIEGAWTYRFAARVGRGLHLRNAEAAQGGARHRLEGATTPVWPVSPCCRRR